MIEVSNLRRETTLVASLTMVGLIILGGVGMRFPAAAAQSAKVFVCAIE